MYEEMPEHYRQTLIKELKYENSAPNVHKDIIIITRNQYEYVKSCLESVCKNTNNFHLYLWDNDSDLETKKLLKSFNPEVLATSEQNLGFISPNNHLASLTMSPFIILLNSDTIVYPGWSEALIGYMHNDHRCGVIGYEGGLLDNSFHGFSTAWGEEIDYVSGWCMCVSRSLYEEIGLFDTNLTFAYGEDSDLSLMAKKLGYNIYALHLSYVKHVGGVTIKEVQKETDVIDTFKKNHEYLAKKWANYKRIVVKKYGKEKIH